MCRRRRCIRGFLHAGRLAFGRNARPVSSLLEARALDLAELEAHRRAGERTPIGFSNRQCTDASQFAIEREPRVRVIHVAKNNNCSGVCEYASNRLRRVWLLSRKSFSSPQPLCVGAYLYLIAHVSHHEYLPAIEARGAAPLGRCPHASFVCAGLLFYACAARCVAQRAHQAHGAELTRPPSTRMDAQSDSALR
eukprot:6206667-Pleurochrysis_carterae.AAC.1